ncbi:MAG: hypothetical protein CMJ75_10140 [Planctomycetaceae bacterium]|nr:hypothetical protein [Planctomycetaceae bacterium]
MRWALLLVLAAGGAVGCRGAVDATAAQRFDEANQAFAAAESREQFLEIANRYQAILDQDVVSGAVLYNQGNAWMRAGEAGRAIASYRRALRFRPRDPQLAANLRSALSSTAVPAEPTPFLGYLFFWQNWLSYPEKFLVTTTLLSVTLLLGILMRFSAVGTACRRGALLSGLLWALSLLSTGWDWHRFERIEHGVVVVEEVTARKGNSENYEPAFTEAVREGAEFQVLARRGDWLHIRLGGSGDAWVESRDVVTY